MQIHQITPILLSLHPLLNEVLLMAIPQSALTSWIQLPIPILLVSPLELSNNSNYILMDLLKWKTIKMPLYGDHLHV